MPVAEPESLRWRRLSGAPPQPDSERRPGRPGPGCGGAAGDSSSCIALGQQNCSQQPSNIKSINLNGSSHGEGPSGPSAGPPLRMFGCMARLRWAGYPSDSGDRGTTTPSGGRSPSCCGPRRTSTPSGQRRAAAGAAAADGRTLDARWRVELGSWRRRAAPCLLGSVVDCCCAAAAAALGRPGRSAARPGAGGGGAASVAWCYGRWARAADGAAGTARQGGLRQVTLGLVGSYVHTHSVLHQCI